MAGHRIDMLDIKRLTHFLSVGLVIPHLKHKVIERICMNHTNKDKSKVLPCF